MHSRKQDRVEMRFLNEEFAGDLYNFGLNHKFQRLWSLGEWLSDALNTSKWIMLFLPMIPWPAFCLPFPPYLRQPLSSDAVKVRTDCVIRSQAFVVKEIVLSSPLPGCGRNALTSAEKGLKWLLNAYKCIRYWNNAAAGTTWNPTTIHQVRWGWLTAGKHWLNITIKHHNSF